MARWITLFSILFVVNSLAAEPAKRFIYANTAEEFKIQMIEHKQRAQHLAGVLLKMHPEDFKGVDPNLLDKFMDQHDQIKTNTSPDFLKKYHLDEEAPIYKVLFSHYNKPVPQYIYKKFSDLELWMAIDFFKEHDLLNADGSLGDIALKYLSLERVSDAVDRGLSPAAVEEFGREMDLARSRLLNHRERELAVGLEIYYAKKFPCKLPLKDLIPPPAH